MARVLVTRRLPDGGIDPLARRRARDRRPRRRHAATRTTSWSRPRAEVDAIVCLLTDRIDASVLEAGAGRLRVVANVAVGYDNVDVAAADRAGIAVCNTPGVLDETTADLAFLLILAASRLASEAEADLRGRPLARAGASTSTSGATCTARRSASSASAASARPSPGGPTGFGMQVLHHTRHDTGAARVDRRPRRACCGERDVVSLHVPLSDETRHLIDARRLALMKPHGGAREHRARTGRRRGGARRSRSRRDASSRPGSTCTSASPRCTRACSRRRGRRCSRTSGAGRWRRATRMARSRATARSRCSPAVAPEPRDPTPLRRSRSRSRATRPVRAAPASCDRRAVPRTSRPRRRPVPGRRPARPRPRPPPRR